MVVKSVSIGVFCLAFPVHVFACVFEDQATLVSDLSGNELLSEIDICAQSGFDFNQSFDGGRSTMADIIATGNSVDGLRRAMDAGGDPNAFYDDDQLARIAMLAFASELDDQLVASKIAILSRDNIDWSAQDTQIESAISVAISKHLPLSAMAILETNPDVNALDRLGRSALYYTGFGLCYSEIGELLLDSGAQVSAMSNLTGVAFWEEIVVNCSGTPQGEAYIARLQARTIDQ